MSKYFIFIAIFLASCSKEDTRYRDGVNHDTMANPGNLRDTITTWRNVVVLLDFDGFGMSSSAWGAFDADHAGLTHSQQQTILDSVRHDFRQFNVTITTSQTIFESVPEHRRQRVTITKTKVTSGNEAGIAYVNSLRAGFKEPAFVYSSVLYYNTMMIAETVSHEIGHTLGLRHIVDNAGKPDNGGVSDSAPIMGTSHWKVGVWTIGTTVTGAVQNDTASISAALKYPAGSGRYASETMERIN